ncbi:hypothetical protein T484DRAFT_1632198 [Baffinella frigidus]|nr:hypothetical protein T484DRAFT_1632198 [Cryptophyta sp. CCMP2293]
MTAFKCILAVLVLATAADPVPLGLAGDFIILAKTGISMIPASAITGNIGVNPIAATIPPEPTRTNKMQRAMTGFDIIADSSDTYSTSAQITGQAYAAYYTSPAPSTMTKAISDMESAYTDPTDGANIDIKAGLISRSNPKL